MALVSWSFPTTIVFGAGALAKLPDHVKRIGGKRALVVCDPGVKKAGLCDRVLDVLKSGGVAAHCFDAVDPNPVEKNVFDGVAAYKDFGADILVAVGGGAPLDTAKLIALKTTHDRPLVDYDDATGGDQFIGPNVPPLVAIPTTAGTGSEVGRSGVVTLEANHRKTVIFSPYLLAKVAILDPELTVSMPARITAATGFDALTHCLEAYCSLGDHPMADAIALGGLELCAQHLVKAVESPKDLDARGGMMKAAMMGAVSFQKGLGACHSLAHPLSSELGMHHGLANALCLPAVLDFNEETALERVLHISLLLGGEAEQGGAGRAVRELRARVGLPKGLAAAGVKPEHLDELADKAILDACHRENPRKCQRADLFALYRASM